MPLPTQGNTNTLNADIHAFCGIRTHDSSVQREKTLHALNRAAAVIGANIIKMIKYVAIIWARHATHCV
jgi:hypothetical protein